MDLHVCSCLLCAQGLATIVMLFLRTELHVEQPASFFQPTHLVVLLLVVLVVVHHSQCWASLATRMRDRRALMVESHISARCSRAKPSTRICNTSLSSITINKAVKVATHPQALLVMVQTTKRFGPEEHGQRFGSIDLVPVGCRQMHY